MRKPTTDYERFRDTSSDNARLLREEHAMLLLTEAICVRLADLGITQAELAKRLDRAPSYVSDLLSGIRDPGIKTLANIAYALNSKLHISFQ